MIVCGWCHGATPAERCALCGRDPAVPWTQRAQVPPTVEERDRSSTRQRLAQVRHEIGPDATNERIAELLGVSERTVRRWMSDE